MNIIASDTHLLPLRKERGIRLAHCLVLAAVLAACGCRGRSSDKPPHEAPKHVKPAPVEDVESSRWQADTERIREQAKVIKDFEVDLRVAQDRVRELSETVRQLQDDAQAAAARDQDRNTEVQRVYQLLKASEEKRVYAENLLKEWNAFYQQYEKQIADYAADVEQQDGVIERLKAEIGRVEADSRPSKGVPERLVPTRSQAVVRSAFSSIIQGMSTDELRNYLGSPDSIEGRNPVVFTYNRPLTYAVDASEKDSSVEVIVEDGAVTRCQFSQ